VRFEDGSQVERQYFPQHSVDGADDAALELTQYEERIAPQAKTPARVWLTQLAWRTEKVSWGVKV
jgi:hypothetical protein